MFETDSDTDSETDNDDNPSRAPMTQYLLAACQIVLILFPLLKAYGI